MAYATLAQLQSATASRLPGSQVMRMPSPYLDMGSTYYPQTIRELLQLCRVFYWTHPLISATISKLARYPVTDLSFTHSKSDEVVNRWSQLLRETLRIRTLLIFAHLDYLTYGNCVEKYTNVVTKDGVFPIQDLAGRTVETLSSDGRLGVLRNRGACPLACAPAGEA